MSVAGALLLLLLGWSLLFAATATWFRHADAAAADRRDRTQRMLDRERMRATYREGTVR